MRTVEVASKSEAAISPSRYHRLTRAEGTTLSWLGIELLVVYPTRAVASGSSEDLAPPYNLVSISHTCIRDALGA